MIDRRRLLKAGIGVGALAGVGALGRYAIIAPPVSKELASVDELAVAEIKGADLAPPLIAALRARSVTPQPASTYRVATTGYLARKEARTHLGRIGAVRSLGLLRDALAAHAKAHGFSSA
jgi:hypothetical protein